MSSFKSKYGPWALVTGGTSGIGSETANIFAAKGLNIILVARRQDLLDEKSEYLRRQYNIDVKTIQADLSKEEDLKKVLQETEGLEIGLLAPIAALENHGVTTEIELEKELALIQLDITSVFVMTHHFGREMVKRKKGGILLVASLIGHMPNPYLSNYAGAKAYIANFGASLHYEMKKYGVDVTVLSPGPTQTPMMDGTGMDVSKTPMSVQTPEYVAKIAVDALGKKPLAIPGFKNNLMVRMSKMMSTRQAINSGGKMMDAVMV